MINKLYHGDCLEVMDQLTENNVKVDAIITDPPYLYLDHKLDKKFNEEDFFSKAYNLLDDGYIAFFGRGASLCRWVTICEKIGFEFKEEIVWDKGRSSSPLHKLARVHELCFIMKKKNSKRNLNDVFINKIEYDQNSNEVQRLENDLKRLVSRMSKIKTKEDFDNFMNSDFDKIEKSKHNITTRNKHKGRDRAYGTYQAHTKGRRLSSIFRVNREHYAMEHPTQKPVQLMELLIKLLSNENSIVLDPFIGSGTTPISCINTNRQYIGIELDKEYFNIATKRVNEAIRDKRSRLF